MPQFSFEGLTPNVHPGAWVAPTAVLVGDVVVEDGASVWYGAVLRADFSPVILRAGANVQDGAVLHGPPGLHTEVGPGATVAHNCVIHGAVLEEECLVANGAVVLDGATVGARSLVAAGSVVAAGTTVPPGFLVAGAPARLKRPVPGSPAELWVAANPSAYRELAQRHREGTEWLRD
ncbi:MAG: gamma carbonic anhydrase family protein [Acidimicrobiia bacterium]|nr:gamma carbonic anhydrase family protein [Acidimicrobiia bacterium]